jgi:transposase
VVGTCKHLGIDPFAYLREALPGLFALGETPTAERLLDWLPDRIPLHAEASSPIPYGDGSCAMLGEGHGC